MDDVWFEVGLFHPPSVRLQPEGLGCQDNWVFLAFVETDDMGGFGGYVINPRPVRWDGDTLRVDADQECQPTGNRDVRVSVSAVANPPMM